MGKTNVFDLKKNSVESIELSVPCIFVLNGFRSQNDNPDGLSKNVLGKVKFMLDKMGVTANLCGDIHDLYLLNENIIDFINNIKSGMFKKSKNLFVYASHLFLPGYFNCYVNKVFNSAILPRIVNKNGEALPVEKAKDNLRKIVFFTHCYGSRVAALLDKKLYRKLRELKYTDQEVQDIQKQLVFIEEAPCCLFSDFKSTCVKFVSLYDNVMFYRKLYGMNNIVAYDEKRNIVSVPRIYNLSKLDDKNKEHHLWSLVARDSMTEQGQELIKVLNIVFYNALTLSRIDNVDSLADFKKLDTNIVQKPMLKRLEKISSKKIQNIIFASSSTVSKKLLKSGFLSNVI